MNRRIMVNIISVLISIFVTFLLTSILILAIGKNPINIFGMMFSEVLGSGYGIGQTLFKATPLIICGTGIAICFHASLFNIGAEGQLNAGAFVMSLVAFKLGSLPVIISLPASLIAGFAISAVVGYIPAIIKIKKGVSEVITTIMLNFVILALINYFLIEFLAAKSTVHTEKISDSLMLPQLADYFNAFQGSSVNISIIFALALAVFFYFIIYKTKFGYKIRALGYNETASKYLGIKTNSLTIVSFMLGAGLTAFAGMNFIMGYKGYYELGFSNNIGFTAIAVALLAKNNPLGIILSSLLFGFLDFGGLAVNTEIPKEIMLVVQAIVILSIISINKLSEKYLNKQKI